MEEMGSGNRRWAGAFRVCPSCGGRNWVGERRCRRCAALLVGVRAVSRPAVAMVGRRAGDRVLTRRVAWMAGGGALLALLSGVGLLYLLKAEAFEADPSAVAEAAVSPPASTPLDPGLAATVAPAVNDTAQALREAERGRRLLAAGHTRAALAALGDSVRALPDDPEVAYLYGRALWRFGAQDRALFQLERAVRLAPGVAAYREELARALQEVGRTAQAIRVLRQGGLMAFDPAEAVMPPSLAVPGESVQLGGAGDGRYRGRRSFTDEDLRRARPVETLPPESAPR